MTKMFSKYCFFAAGISLLLLGCSQDKSKVNLSVSTPKPAVLMAPFRYHKTIEVVPGQDFDIMSWGRGSTNKGSLLILRSDTVNKIFTTTTGDLDGAITDVFNADMDADGRPELLIEAKAKDTVDYTSIYAYEFNDSRTNKLDFPKLTSSQKKGYRGVDNFYMKEGKLIREFPIYDGNSSMAKPTGQKRVLQYNMRSNNLTVKDLSADTLKTINTPVKTEPAVTKTPEKQKTSVSSSKKKQSTKHKETPKKKKRRHRS